MTKIITTKLIEENIDYSELMNEIEKYYQMLKEGKINVTNRIFTDTKDGGKYIIGGATNLENENFIVMGQQVMPWFAEKGMPIATTSYMYSSFRTGELKAIVADVVKYRTPAKSALVAKYLAQNKETYTLGIIGLGVQAITHAQAFTKLFNVSRIIATSNSPEKRKNNLDEIELKTGVKVELLSKTDVIKNSDILILVTSSKEVLVSFEDLHKGQLVIGTDHAESVNRDVVLKADKVYVDYRPTAENEFGPIKILLENGNKYEDLVYGDLLQLSSGEIQGRNNEDEIIFFQSLGVLHENLAAVEYLYSKLKHQVEEVEI